ncbi:hypothetical protein ABT187_43280 [Streptomyces sp. NPDC001817]|uniref:hypothetical protein n=1 Tax=Streptomyces sp. NPDC001817 TaxID=3154398 RepID=UPI00331AF09D
MNRDMDTQAIAAGMELIRKAQAKINRDQYTDRSGASWKSGEDDRSPYQGTPTVHGVQFKACLHYTADGTAYEVIVFDFHGQEHGRAVRKGLDAALKAGKRMADGDVKPSEAQATKDARAAESAERERVEGAARLAAEVINEGHPRKAVETARKSEAAKDARKGKRPAVKVEDLEDDARDAWAAMDEARTASELFNLVEVAEDAAAQAERVASVVKSKAKAAARVREVADDARAEADSLVCGTCGCLRVLDMSKGAQVSGARGSLEGPCGCRALCAVSGDDALIGALLDAESGWLREAGEFALIGDWAGAAERVEDAFRYEVHPVAPWDGPALVEAVAWVRAGGSGVAGPDALAAMLPVIDVDEGDDQSDADQDVPVVDARPVDPGYSLDVAEGERMFSRPGFADGGSYAGRAAILRDVVTVADARAAVARFPETLRTSGGAVVAGRIVPMGCAMLRALDTVRTDAGYEVTLPDGTVVTGTWVECGNAFAEWAVTQRPEFVCVTAEGYADGYATVARINAGVRAKAEAERAAVAEAAAEVERLTDEAARVWSAWAPAVDYLDDADADRVEGADHDVRTNLRYAREAVERGDAGAAGHYAQGARRSLGWLRDGAERGGLTIAEPVPAADQDDQGAPADDQGESDDARRVRIAEQRVREAQGAYEKAQLPGMWKDMTGRRIGIARAMESMYGACQGLAAVNGAPFLAVPDISRTGHITAWRVLECSPHEHLGTVTRIVSTHTTGEDVGEDAAEREAEELNARHAEGASSGAEAPSAAEDEGAPVANGEFPPPGDDVRKPAPEAAPTPVDDAMTCPPGLYVVSLPSTRYRDWWGVECGRCVAGVRTPIKGQWSDQTEAYGAAQLHYELTHRPADDVLSAAELDEVASWPWQFSAAQVQLLGWIEECKVDEYQNGVWACDVAYDRFDVNKRVSKPRVLGLLRAGLVKVMMDAPGELRAFRLTDEGRRVLRLWHRAHRHGLVTEAAKDVKHAPAKPGKPRPYPWRSDGELFEAERRALAERGDDQDQGDAPEAAAREGGDAAESAPDVDWSEAVVKVMEAAAGAILWNDTKGGYRSCGRKVSTDRVHTLMRAGLLYQSADGRVYATDDGKRALAEHQDQGAPVSAPVEPVRLALTAPPVRLALTAAPSSVPVEVERQDAAKAVAALRWCKAFADVVRAARDGAMFPEGDGFRLMGPVGSKGRRVKAERVRLLTGAGFLALESSGLVVPTADGLEALRLIDLAPEALWSESDAMQAVRKAKRARQWDSIAGQEANALPPLPDGGEVARRQAAARKATERWQAQAEESRKRTEATLAKARIRDRKERQEAEKRRVAAEAPCRDCRGMYPVEVRCGKCRERAAMGLPMVDFLALPPAPVRSVADIVSEPGTVDGWEGDGGACPEIASPLVDETWRNPRGGTADPVLPALPVSRGVTRRDRSERGERVTLAGPAGRTTYARMASGGDSLDVFAALDAELSAAAADWDRLIPA